MFTLVPIDVEGEDVMELSKRFYLVVLVGLVLGLIGGTAMFLLTEVYSPFVCAIIVVFLLMGLNRFLHLDGLTDMGDGLMVLGDQERKMTVMKDSHIGAGGMAYAMLFTLLSVGALSGVGHDFYFLAPLTAEVMIKVSMVACASVGDAKEGMGGIFVRNTDGNNLLIAVALALIIIVPAWIWLSPDWISAMGKTLTLVLIVLVTTITGAYVARLAMKHFGCVNGDILGATNEIARPIVLLAISGAIWAASYLH
ncbi:MAG: cobalamin synthase [Methanomassiliicoccales archaeon PtaU1.Bin124]|nr:MAG: cobalamin synthase [Methanomassiliicoccales archaeon PtaU1.Bin124]